MCGIAGFIDFSGKGIDLAILKSMNDVISHRGPDDEGYVLIDQMDSRFRTYSGPDSPAEVQEFHPPFLESDITFACNIGLSHRRFSIIDLTAEGHQPFIDNDRSCCVVTNGEIYNYIELRAELESQGIIFRSHSDTEVLLEAYKAWGIDCFKRFNGVWSLALYDFRKKCLILSRDPIGKRPLYWARKQSRVYFASEIKSLLKVPELARNKMINQDAIWYWCNNGLRDLDFSTCFKDIFTFPSASWTIVDENFPNKIKTYWKVPNERLSEKDIGISEAAKLVRETLEEAVSIRLRSDVSLAAELSGGLDSSAILALMAKHYPERITTYTVRFSDPHWNEEPFARSLAKHYNVDYRVINDPPFDTFWQNILAFTYLQEEPFHSPNMQTSQVIWAQMRSQETKVVLTGAAGDEMFAGYAKYYPLAQRENLKTGYYSQFIKNSLHWTERRKSGIKVKAKALPKKLISPIWRLLKYFVPQVKMLRGRNLHDLYNIPMPQKRYSPKTLTETLYSNITNTQIPYWLRSGDKVIMGMPIESRCPFLDYRVIEIATKLPITYLIRNGWHKWILRKSLEDIIPSDVLWRKKKMGFPFPYQTFIEDSRNIIDFIICQASNPYVDLSGKAELTELKKDWRAISFILWYELFFNENYEMFEKIESMVKRSRITNNHEYIPAFLNSFQIAHINS